MGSSDVNSSQTYDGAVPAAEIPEGVVSGAGFMHDMLLFGDPTLMAVVAGKIKSSAYNHERACRRLLTRTLNLSHRHAY